MTVSNRVPEPIAIVGMGCRFPGGSNSPELYWEMLVRGGVVIRDVPADRWDRWRFFDRDKDAPGKSIACAGGFIDRPIDEFDASFFGISPREAAPLDPQQRLLLEVTWEAVADAGLAMERLAGTRVGVFVGAFGVDNQLLQMSRGGRYLAGPYTIAGCSAAMLSNRLSFTFGWTGPSLTIDTACSSSLVAVHYACRSLVSGESEAAIVGGVNLMFHPDFAIGLGKARFLSSDGRSKAFDRAADGYGRGEGAGVVVLKRLSRAVADGDRVRALIRGTGVNQDGHTPGITVPSGAAQATLMREVCRAAAVDPGAIRYVEAHGTGTAVGDPIEANAIGQAIGSDRPIDDPCYLGSVKANMGHLEAAAGIAGVIKAALCLEHREIPPHPLATVASPDIPFADLGLRLADRRLPWPRGSSPAIAAVNSFGFGGTNAHVLLEEARPAEAPVDDELLGDGINGRSHLFTISAASKPALLALVHAHRDALERRITPVANTVGDLCHASSARASHLSHRLAIVVDSIASLDHALADYASGVARAASRDGVVASLRPSGPVFVFTGMGPQWWGMGRELLRDEPVFRATIERIDDLFHRHAGWSLLAEMTALQGESRVALTEVAQPLNFALQAGLTELWRSWGIEPAAVVGHSVGEVAAAFVAGALTLEDAVRVSFHRGRLQGTMRGKGAMLAVGLSADQARGYLERYDDRAVVAAINSPATCTLAGEPAALAEIADRLADHQVFHRFLKVDIAYHSPQMDPLEAELTQALDGLRPREPRVPLYSTVTGKRAERSACDAQYWWQNVRQPVRFASAVSEILGAGHDTFLEIGPHPALGGSIADLLTSRGVSGRVLASLKREAPERPALLDALGALYTAGFAIQWRGLYPKGGRPVRLPSYPWQRERHWCESVESREDRLGNGGHPLLDQTLRTPEPAWESELGSTIFPYLADHQIEGTSVFPAAGYIEACLAASLALESQRARPVVIEDVALLKAMVLGHPTDLILHVALDTRDRVASIHSRPRGTHIGWELHARARILEPRDQGEAAELVNLDDIRRRCQTSHDIAAVYERLSARGLNYGPLFQGIRALWSGPSEVIAQLELPAGAGPGQDRYHLHPVLVDAGFQALFCAIDERSTDGLGAERPTYLPVEIGRVRYFARPGARVWCHGRITECGPKALIGDVQLLDESGSVLADIRRFKCQALKAGGAGAEPDRAESWLYDVAWRPMGGLGNLPVSPLDPTDSHTTGLDVPLIFADRAGVGERLSDLLTEHGLAPIVVLPATTRSRVGERRFEINPARGDDMDWLLNEIPSSGSPLSMVYLWGLDILDPEESVELTPEQAGLTDCITLSHWIQALARVTANGPSRLWIVTERAQAVAPGDSVPAPGQTALHGFARVLEVEHPELRCTTVDLDRGELTDRARSLADEVLGNSPESEIAVRESVRHASRIVAAGADRAARDRAPRLVPADVPYRLEVTRQGSFDNLILRECERRPPGPGEVEVRVLASGLNYKDVLKVMGVLSEGVTAGTWSGRTLGLECSGVIERIGPGVKAERLGEEVQGWVADGFRAYLTARAEQFSPLYKGLTIVEAAAVPVVFLTAYYGLHEIARLRAGESVLIHAASGGVGLAAIQVARALGAEVFATAGSPEKRDYLRALGIAHVMDSRTLDFADRVLEHTNGRGVDVVLNSLTGEALRKSVGILAPYGRFIEIGKRDIDADHPLGLKPFNRNLMFAAIDLDRLLVDRPEAVSRMQGELAALFDQGALGPLPVTAYPADQAGDAFRLLAQAKHIGKVVVTHGAGPVSVAPPGRRPLAIRGNATYLITGGMGGFGLETARWLVDRGATSLVLAGRGGARTPEALDAVKELERRGARVTVAAVDVGDSGEVARLIAEIKANLPPLAGVFHAAMVLDDGLIDQLDDARFAAVMAPKARGAWNLHMQTRDLALDVFVMYSSMVAVLGNVGQASYAAANAFLDGLAHYRRARGLPALSVHWGSLSEAGFVARNPAIARHLERSGLIGIPPRRALEVLEQVLVLDRPEIGVAHVDWSRWRQTAPGLANRPRFAEVIASEALATTGQGGGGTAAWLASLRAASALERMDLAISSLREVFARVLRLPALSIDPNHPINQLGIDSLMAVELQTLIATETGASFSTMDFMGGPTLTSMAERLLAKVLPGHEPTVAPRQETEVEPLNEQSPATHAPLRPDQPGHTPDTQAIGYPAVTDIDRLSEFEIDELLASMIAQEPHH